MVPSNVITEVHRQRTEAEAAFGRSRGGYAPGWYLGPLGSERLLRHFGGFGVEGGALRFDGERFGRAGAR